MNPQSIITFPLGVTTYYSAKAINSNGEHARITYEHKYKRGKSNILLKHNLNIISQSIGSQQTHHSRWIVLLALPILEARRRRNRDEIAKKGSRPEGFETRVKYRPKGDVRGLLGGPGAPPG